MRPIDDSRPNVSVAQRTACIRALNDQLRCAHRGGIVMLSAGIAGAGAAFAAKALLAISQFNTFDAGNDPYGEHDFGRVTVDGQSVLFKIDAYDRSLRLHSPDAADPLVTRRVMTVMLAEEY